MRALRGWCPALLVVLWACSDRFVAIPPEPDTKSVILLLAHEGEVSGQACDVDGPCDSPQVDDPLQALLLMYDRPLAERRGGRYGKDVAM